MKTFTSTILLLGILVAGGPPSIAGQADVPSQETTSMVSRLSWDSIGMNCNVLGGICPESDEAKRLVRIGKPATDALLKVLGDKDKGVAAHVILTQIWEPRSVRGAMRFGEDRYFFTYNGLEWAEVFEEGSSLHRVEMGALTMNAAEWRRKIGGYRKWRSGTASAA